MNVFEYKLKKNSKLGITAMSIVDEPAIMIDFLKLNKEVPKLKLQVDEEQMIITGPALIPDLKIFRTAESMGTEEDGYIYFSKETVKEMAELFMTNEWQNTVTLDHETLNSDLRLVESWIVSKSDNDKSNALGFDVPDGTWMCSYKVENIELWDKIKSGDYNGFSIEAMDFEKKLVEMNKEVEELTEEEIIKIISDEIDEREKKIQLEEDPDLIALSDNKEHVFGDKILINGNELQLSTESISKSSPYTGTENDLDNYVWTLGDGGLAKENCPSCLGYAGSVRSLRAWKKRALPATLASEWGGTYKYGPYGTFCEDHCTCFLIKIS